MTARLGAATLSTALLAATLAGCGGGSGDSSSDSSPSFASSKELAAAVGCKDYEEDGGQALASSGGGCDTADAGFVAINMFDDNDTATSSWTSASRTAATTCTATSGSSSAPPKAT